MAGYREVTPELWVLFAELASCHTCGAKNTGVSPRFLEDLSTPSYGSVLNAFSYGYCTGLSKKMDGI